MGTIHRKTAKGMVVTGDDDISVEVFDLGEWGGRVNGTRVVRLISHEPLNAKVAAEAITAATKFVEKFKAQLLVTPGGFGEAGPEFHGREIETFTEAVQGYVAHLLQFIPAKRHFDIVLGVDSQCGYVQDVYFISREAHLVQECQRAWKSYPRCDEMYLYTKGKPCRNRVVFTHGDRICLLVCHDMAAFSGRSQANRGQQREIWVRQIDLEVARGPNTGLVHLIHYLNSHSEGKVFTNGMEALIGSGVAWGISTFKTKLYRTADWQGLRKIEEQTARFAGPTLDLYVRPSKSKKGSNGDNK